MKIPSFYYNVLLGFVFTYEANDVDEMNSITKLI